MPFTLTLSNFEQCLQQYSCIQVRMLWSGGVAMRWVNTWLDDQAQRVVNGVNWVNSTWRLLKSRVLQRSILQPDLFNMTWKR